jgi:diketogulonate reductase-like aldo/keto reductase
LVDPSQTRTAVEQALKTGHRHIDTATDDGNEAQVGATIRAGGPARRNIFVTTKLHNDHHKAGDVVRAFRLSPDALGIGHIDLSLTTGRCRPSNRGRGCRDEQQPELGRPEGRRRRLRDRRVDR